MGSSEKAIRNPLKRGQVGNAGFFQFSALAPVFSLTLDPKPLNPKPKRDPIYDLVLDRFGVMV